MIDICVSYCVGIKFVLVKLIVKFDVWNIKFNCLCECCVWKKIEENYGKIVY